MSETPAVVPAPVTPVTPVTPDPSAALGSTAVLPPAAPTVAVLPAVAPTISIIPAAAAAPVVSVVPASGSSSPVTGAVEAVLKSVPAVLADVAAAAPVVQALPLPAPAEKVVAEVVKELPKVEQVVASIQETAAAAPSGHQDTLGDLLHQGEAELLVVQGGLVAKVKALVSNEPVVVGEFVKIIAAAAVEFGAPLPHTYANVAAAAVYTGLTLLVRTFVTPAAKAARAREAALFSQPPR